MLPPPIKPTWMVIRLERSRLLQQLFHARPTLPCGFFRRTGATPVRLQADGELVSITLEGSELSFPIDHPATHGRPFVALAICLLHRVLAVAVPDPIFGQEVVSLGIRR